MPKTQIGFMASSFSSPLRVVRHKQMTSKDPPGKSPKYTYERISFMNKWLGYVPWGMLKFPLRPTCHMNVFFSQHLFVGPKFRLVSLWIRFCPMLGKQVKIMHLFHPR